MFGCPSSIKRKYLIDISLLFAGLNFRQAIFASPYKDWEAPTGGYLLTGCLASGRAAGLGTKAWLDAAST